MQQLYVCKYFCFSPSRLASFYFATAIYSLAVSEMDLTVFPCQEVICTSPSYKLSLQ